MFWHHSVTTTMVMIFIECRHILLFLLLGPCEISMIFLLLLFCFDLNPGLLSQKNNLKMYSNGFLEDKFSSRCSDNP